MSDEKFEQFVKNAAQSYNAPPARVPREEMWESIKAARSAGPRVIYGGGSHLRAENRFGVKAWWAVAAALLLVTSGIGIGRWTASPSGPEVVPTSSDRIANPGEQATSDPGRPDTLRPPGSEVVLGRASGAESTPRVQSGSRGSNIHEPGGRESGRVATAAVAGDWRGADRPGSPDGTALRGPQTSAYQLAEMNHLSEAEALLTSFRTRSPSDQQHDARLAAWARELLSNTRLLLDSPVAQDPQRRPLLQDLELLLVQIVQLSPGSTPRDREIVERTLQQDNLMTKLRTAIPAGQRGS